MCKQESLHFVVFLSCIKPDSPLVTDRHTHKHCKAYTALHGNGYLRGVIKIRIHEYKSFNNNIDIWVPHSESKYV